MSGPLAALALALALAAAVCSVVLVYRKVRPSPVEQFLTTHQPDPPAPGPPVPDFGQTLVGMAAVMIYQFLVYSLALNNIAHNEASSNIPALVAAMTDDSKTARDRLVSAGEYKEFVKQNMGTWQSYDSLRPMADHLIAKLETIETEFFTRSPTREDQQQYTR